MVSKESTHAVRVACSVFLAALAVHAAAADVAQCLKLSPRAGADAVLANACSQRLNLMLCVEGGKGTLRCADKPRDVITLFPGASVAVAGYDGVSGSLHWAVCVYPEAPVGWDPGPDRPYACKKTCVMC
jgi:hypothetical protein